MKCYKEKIFMLEITDPVFGRMCYEHRWIKKEDICIFGKNQQVNS